jgi:hypothetical protein
VQDYGSGFMLLQSLGIFLVILILLVAVLYILGALTLYRIGKKAELDWAWVAWIPGGSLFVIAKVVNWDKWALFPILVIGDFVLNWIPVLGQLFNIAVDVFLIIQLAQLIMLYRRSALILLWNLLPGIGSIIFYIILFNMSADTPNLAVPRTWYGSKIGGPQGNNFSA